MRNYARGLLAPAMLGFLAIHLLEDIALITIGAHLDPWWLRYVVGIVASWLLFGLVFGALMGKSHRH